MTGSKGKLFNKPWTIAKVFFFIDFIQQYNAHEQSQCQEYADLIWNGTK